MPIITPSTKVAELLEHWPELEAVLIAQSPAFQKLRNPVLRRTIARVASLEQAAAIAGVSARDLVITLRRAVGQAVDDTPGPEPPATRADLACAHHAPVPPTPEGPKRDHLAGPLQVIDADTLLDAGDVPLKPIFEAAAALAPGETLRVLASFRPVPLIERLEAQGYDCVVTTGVDGRFVVSIARRKAG